MCLDCAWLLSPLTLQHCRQQWQSELAPTLQNTKQGGEICERFRAQSLRFGTKIFSETVTKVDFSKRPFHIFTGG